MAATGNLADAAKAADMASAESEVSFAFACFTCGRRVFLIRGMCDACAPDLHWRHQQLMAAYVEAHKRYVSETGRQPLDDYEAFDAWVRRQ